MYSNYFLSCMCSDQVVRNFISLPFCACKLHKDNETLPGGGGGGGGAEGTCSLDIMPIYKKVGWTLGL